MGAPSFSKRTAPGSPWRQRPGLESAAGREPRSFRVPPSHTPHRVPTPNPCPAPAGRCFLFFRPGSVSLMRGWPMGRSNVWSRPRLGSERRKGEGRSGVGPACLLTLSGVCVVHLELSLPLLYLSTPFALDMFRVLFCFVCYGILLILSGQIQTPTVWVRPVDVANQERPSTLGRLSVTRIDPAPVDVYR